MENLSLDEENLQTLVVSPNGLCSLVCVANGYVYWSTFTNPANNKLYKSDNDGNGKDYMELQINEIGETSLVYHYADSTTTQIEIESSALEEFFGGTANISFTYNDFNVEHTTGCPSRDELNCFRIRKENYKISAHLWFLKFSVYKAFFASSVESDEKYLLPCRVHQTFCMDDFIKICKDLKIQCILDETLKDMELRHRISSNHRIIQRMQKVSTTEKEVYDGLFEGCDVAVKVIKQKKSFSKIYNNLWVTNACSSITRFYGAEYVEGNGNWILAFEHCPMTLRDYMMIFKGFRFSGSWRSIMREILVGLEFIHNKDLCHNNLNPDHILLTAENHPKICGMSRCKKLTDELRAWDLYCFGRILLHFFTGGAHTFEDEDHHGQEIVYTNLVQRMSARLSDVRCVIEELLNPVASQRPSMEWVQNHLWLWDSERRLNFLKEVSDTIYGSNNYPTLKSAIDGCYMIPFRNRKGEGNWRDGFEKEPLLQMFGHRGYDTRSVCELLRFMRNFMNHRDSVDDAARSKIGLTDDMIERNFDAKFPGLLSSVYNQMEVLIPQLPNFSRVPGYYHAR